MAFSDSFLAQWWRKTSTRYVVFFGVALALLYLGLWNTMAASDEAKAAQHLEQVDQLLSKIQQEVDSRKAAGEPLTLSPALIEEIVSTSQQLHPLPYQDEHLKEERLLSDARGRLLASLSHLQLDKSTYDQIYKKANFEKAVLHWDIFQLSSNGHFVRKHPAHYLQGVNLKGASFRDLDYLGKLNLSGAQLQGSDFEGANMKGIDFKEANLEGAVFDGVWVNACNFEAANMKAVLLDGTFYNCDFSNSQLSAAQVGSSRYNVCTLSYAKAPNSDFSQSIFTYCDLSHADFQKSDFSGCHIFSCYFKAVECSHCNFEQSRLHFCDWSQANLSGANFEESIVRRVGLEGCNLEGSQWAQARVYQPNFMQVLEQNGAVGVSALQEQFTTNPTLIDKQLRVSEEDSLLAIPYYLIEERS